MGLAVCDPSRKFVFGRPTLERSSPERDFSALEALCRDDAIVLVVVGLPINADGTEGGAAKAARAWAARLGEGLRLPTVLVDERYTTIEADEALRLQHRDWRERRKKIDKAAATLILQTFLDHGPHREKPDFGRFVGTVKAEWVAPDREMRLLADFAYVDQAKSEWKAPAGSIIDGASIPRILWTVVGSPFTGSYRNASVVHDVACKERTRPWQDVHRMFYAACRCGGVSEIQSKILFGAVYRFGPRWSLTGAALTTVRTQPLEDDFDALQAFITSKNPSLDAIERFEP